MTLRKQARSIRKQIKPQAFDAIDALFRANRETLGGLRKWQQNIWLALKLGEKFDSMILLPEPFESFDHILLGLFVGVPLVLAWRRKGGAA